jgi:hypothetical protein
MPIRSSALSNSDQPSRVDKFKQAARDLEWDEDEARWDATLKKVAKQKPTSEKPD